MSGEISPGESFSPHIQVEFSNKISRTLQNQYLSALIIEAFEKIGLTIKNQQAYGVNTPWREYHETSFFQLVPTPKLSEQLSRKAEEEKCEKNGVPCPPLEERAKFYQERLETLVKKSAEWIANSEPREVKGMGIFSDSIITPKEDLERLAKDLREIADNVERLSYLR